METGCENRYDCNDFAEHVIFFRGKFKAVENFSSLWMTYFLVEINGMEKNKINVHSEV